MNNEITIAIIDDGVSKSVIQNLCFDLYYDNGSIRENKSDISPYSHGSICAAIIRKYAPQARIGSIRILDTETKQGNVSALVDAISWCVEHKIKITHMSIGSVEVRDVIPLYEVINKACDSIIIAACKNGRNVTFPASFQNVIGIKVDKNLTDNQYGINAYPNGGIEFTASSCHGIELATGLSVYETPICNSYAAPVITAEVYRHLTINPNYSFGEIKAVLYNQMSGEMPRSSTIIRHYAGIPFDDTYPVVVFHGKNAVAFAKDIAMLFLQDGYLPLMFSTHCENANFIYLDDIKLLESSVHSMVEYCGADLILAAVDEKNINITADIFIDSDACDNIDKYTIYKSLVEKFSE